MRHVSIIQDMWGFLKVRKKFWLLPLFLLLLMLGVIIAVTAGSAFAPFIYTLF